MSQVESELVLRLRPGVEYTSSVDGGDIDYGDQGCLIESPEHRQSIIDILEKLKLGTTESSFSNIAIAGSVLGQLDTLGLILKTTSKPTIGTSGKELSRVLTLATQRVQQRLGNQPLANRFLQGKATRELLIGYAMEYYMLVKAAPSVLGSALNHELPPVVWRQIKQLFLTEHDHHLLLETSLKAVDISPELAGTYLPLRFVETIAPAVARNLSPDFKRMFRRYLVEELGHEEFDVETCVSAGIEESELRSRTPLVLTDAFCDVYVLLASEDLLAYVLSIVLTEGLPSDAVAGGPDPTSQEFSQLSGVEKHDAFNALQHHQYISRWLSRSSGWITPQRYASSARIFLFVLELNHRLWGDIQRTDQADAR